MPAYTSNSIRQLALHSPELILDLWLCLVQLALAVGAP